jgi:hypothetical protein
MLDDDAVELDDRLGVIDDEISLCSMIKINLIF